MSPARTTTPRRSRAAKKTTTNTPAARPPAPASAPPKTPAEPPPPVAAPPAADPVLADAADRAADVLALSEDQALTVLERTARAAGHELATARQWAEEAEQLRATAADEAQTVTERADRAAGQILADAEQTATGITRAASEQADRITAEAQATAATLTGDAEQNASTILARARRQADNLLADAEQSAAALTQGAGEQAGKIRDQAQRDAEELREQAGREASKLRQDATSQADTALGEARTQAGALIAEACEQAEELRRTAQTDADRVRGEVRRLREEADREVDQATAAAREVRAQAAAEADQVRAQVAKEVRQQRTQTAAEAARLLEEASKDASRMVREAERASGAAKAETAKDACAVREDAKQEARRIRREAEQLAVLDKAEAGRAVDEARLREEQAGQAKQAADQALEQARKVLEKATSRTVRRLEKRRLKREARAAERAGKPTLSGRLKAFVKANSKRLLAIVPITAPMAVAWTGQAGFAHDILNWVAPFTILFAAAWELSTAFVAWMYHEARQGGDSGTLYRVATWVFAVGAAVMNYWHASGEIVGQQWDPIAMKMVDHVTYWHATPKAVAFSVMSITGMVLWELYARLIHRQKLRADGKVAKSRPTIGVIRWARYPGHSFAAWSLAITDESLSTVELAWTAAANHRALVRRTRRAAGLGPVRRTVAAIIGVGDWVPVRGLPRIPNTTLAVALAGSANPASVPQFAVNLTRAGSPNRFANQYGGSANPALPAARTASQNGLRELEAANPADHTARPGELATADPEPRTGPEQARRTVRTSGDEAPAAGSNRRSAAQMLADEQVQQVLDLIGELGYDAVVLDVVIEKTGMKRTTAHHRLAEARKEFTNRPTAAKPFANQSGA